MLYRIVEGETHPIAKDADKVIYGNFYTVDKDRPRAEAVAIVDGRFAYVGDESGARDYVGKQTEVRRFEGGLILPGMGEGHGHVNHGATLELFQVQLFGGTSLEEYRTMVREHIERHPEQDVIQGMGFLIVPDFEQGGPTAEMLDDLSDKPIVLADAGHHSYWVNHAAMERVDIDRSTPDVADGIIVRDADGNPTGWFREGAANLLQKLVVYSPDQYKEAILDYQERYLAQGETMFLDPIINNDGTDNATEAFHQLDVEGKLHMHAFAAYQVFQGDGHDTMAEIEHAARLRKETRGTMFDLSNIKIQLDGVIGGNPPTALLKEPYSDPVSQETHYCGGQPRFDLETLTAVYKRAHELGFTVHLHAIGDAALSMALDAIEAALGETGPHDLRDAITHLQLVDPADIARMAQMGVIASTDPFWLAMDNEYFAAFVPLIGAERAEAQLPIKSFFDAGVVVTSASDYSAEIPAFPLIGIQRGVIRQVPGHPETVHNPDERVSVEQMIESSTLNVAYQLLCDDRLGSITCGKEADLVVLGDDIFALDPEHIADAEVLATMVGGEWVHTRA